MENQPEYKADIIDVASFDIESSKETINQAPAVDMLRNELKETIAKLKEESANHE